ncbi:MAG TPA: helix-turn-helix domain-containing protein [Tepidisphaeraceae bacterium]|nr:helix-turn-helix domain-containing protein [Tepidisphaeraceae bacterium]
MAERSVSSPLSGDVIDLLMKRGMTLTAIAETIGATKSFVSRVKSRSRSLTIDHLMALEGKLGEPLPLLLLEATPIDSIPHDLRPLYRSTQRVLDRTRKRPKAADGRASKVA